MFVNYYKITFINTFTLNLTNVFNNLLIKNNDGSIIQIYYRNILIAELEKNETLELRNVFYNIYDKTKFNKIYDDNVQLVFKNDSIGTSVVKIYNYGY